MGVPGKTYTIGSLTPGEFVGDSYAVRQLGVSGCSSKQLEIDPQTAPMVTPEIVRTPAPELLVAS